MSESVRTYPIAHAVLTTVRHPELGVDVRARSAVRYLRFMRRMKIQRLELPHSSYGRWMPTVPCHPAHILVSTFDSSSRAWRQVAEFDLPRDPRIAGEGLTQSMSVQEMDERLKQVLKDPPRVFDLAGVETDCLRVECDREHPVWPNHGECNGGALNVPFGVLNPLRAFGEAVGKEVQTPYHPPLRVGTMRPRAPRGMRVSDLPNMLLFEGRHLSIGFSMRRPAILHLGWDALGKGHAAANRLLASRVHGGSGLSQSLGGLSGPIVRSLDMDSGCHWWTGQVSVRGNRVTYHNLHGVPGVRVDAAFTVEPRRILLELRQRCDAALPVIEAEAWRLCWDEAAGITGAAALPVGADGRSGGVELPMMWATDGVGCLLCSRVEGDAEQARLQVESYRAQRAVTGGFVLAPRPRAGETLVLPEGERRAVFEWAVANLEPAGRRGRAVPEGVRRQWAATFACFRPEYRGFSNHAASVNCHLSQFTPVMVAAHTRPPKRGPDPIRLARFTIETALLDGGGYGYWRNLYLDSDPNLVAAAGLIHAARPDVAWLRRIEPGLRAAVRRMHATIGPEGLALCRDLSGNSGSYRWSSNSMDVVGFGHMDAYVNAFTYVAMRGARRLFEALEHRGEARRAEEAGDRLRAAYPRFLLNPDTGWVAGWRSRDGALHDAAFLWVNGLAICAGLLDRKAARRALRGLERLRRRCGAGSARCGLPFNLLPLAKGDHMLPVMHGEALPTFENYTDGSMSGWTGMFYLRALRKYGFAREAALLAAELDEGYACGMHSGGMGSGIEFRGWDGVPCGYEGSLIGCFGGLYAIAVSRGLMQPVDPDLF